MAFSARALFAAGLVLAAGSLSAGLVYCAQADAPPPWQRLAAAVGVNPAQDIPADARCGVCGMYPARFPRWAAQLVLRDGSIRWFDSPLEFFVFQADLARYGKGVKAEDIVGGFVTDYDKGGWVAASKAYYVRGSDARGPMGNDALPAFGSRVAAAAFAAAHGGEVLAFAGIDPALVDALHGSAAHHH